MIFSKTRVLFFLLALFIGIHAQEDNEEFTDIDEEKINAENTEEGLGKYGEWETELSAGLTATNGNNDSESVNTSVEVEHKLNKFRTTLDSNFIYTSERNKARTHIINHDFASRYHITTDDYIVGTFFYEKDRFNGFDWRTIYTLGYGHHIHIAKEVELVLEGGTGVRRFRVNRGNRDGDSVVRGRAELDWAISEGVNYESELTIISGHEGTEYRAENSLTTAIRDNVSLKLEHTLFHNTEAVKGTKDTTTILAINLVYTF